MADAPTMSKEKSDKKEKKEKRDKHSKKEKHADKNGVSKSKKDKKDKDKKTLAVPAEGAEKLLQDIDSRERDVTILPKKIEGGAGDNGAAGGGDVMDVDEDVKMENGEDAENVEVQITPRGALVPFANPLADERTAKRVFKSVKKANKHKALKRGVKEVVKTLRKSPAVTNAIISSETPIGIVVIAADISPMDVISHIPVLCEDHGVPYIYVTSRAELGAAGMTKRPTSVVLVNREKGKAREKKRKDGDEGKEAKEGKKEEKEGEKEEEWDEVFRELAKVVRKAGRDVKV